MLNIFRTEEKLHLSCLGLYTLAFAYFYLNYPFRFDFLSVAPFLMFSLIIFMAGIYYRLYRNEKTIASTLIVLGIFIAFSYVSLLLNYSFIGMDRPFIDAWLADIDQRLGFVWPDAVAFVQRYPLLDSLSTAAYASSLPQLALLIPILGLSGKTWILDKLILSVFLSLAITLAIWAAYPSLGSATYFYQQGYDVDYSGLVLGKDYVDAMLEIYNGIDRQLSLSDLEGIVSFPSFHTVLALLGILASWHVRYLRWPYLVLNCLVILSVPVDGSHHMIDVPGGIAVGLMSFYLAGWLLNRQAKLKPALA